MVSVSGWAFEKNNLFVFSGRFSLFKVFPSVMNYCLDQFFLLRCLEVYLCLPKVFTLVFS